MKKFALLLFFIFEIGRLLINQGHTPLTGDAGIYLWLCEEFHRHFSFTHWFETNAFYPYGKTLAWTDNFLLPSFFYSLLRYLGSTPEFAFSLLLVSARSLGAWSLFLLARALGMNIFGSLCAGLLALVSAYFSMHLGHPQLQFFFWLPLGLLTLRPKMLEEHPSKVGVLLSLCVLGAFLSSVYFAIFLALLASILLLRHLFSSSTRRRFFLGNILLGALPAGTCLAPFALPYFDVAAVFGGRHLYEAHYFSAAGTALFSFPSSSQLYDLTAVLSHGEAQFGFGIILLLGMLFVFSRFDAACKCAVGLAILAGCCSSFRPLCQGFILPSELCAVQSAFSFSRYAAAFFCWTSICCCFYSFFYTSEKKCFPSEQRYFHSLSLLAILCFLLSLGPLGNPEKGQFPIGPFAVFFEFFPAGDAIRASARFLIFPLLFSFLCFAYLLSEISKMHSPKRFALGLLLLVAVNEEQATHAPFLATRSFLPKKFQEALLNLPKTSIIAFLPYAPALDKNKRISSWSQFADANTWAALQATAVDRRTLNGYSGIQTGTMRELPRALAEFPSTRAFHALAGFAGLDTLVVSTPTPEREARLKKGFAEFPAELSLLSHEGNFWAFQFHPRIMLQKSFALRLPPATRQLRLNFQNIAQRELAFKIFEVDHAGKRLVKQIALRKSSDVQNIEFQLPPASSAVRPFRLLFEGEEISQVLYLGATVPVNE